MSTLSSNSALVRLLDEIDRVEKALLDRLKGNRMIASTKPETTQIDANKPRGQTVPIAIVGMAAILPDSRNTRQYWENIVRGVDCIKEVPPSRWDVDDYYDSDPLAPDKTYCKRGGFIPKIEFDPVEFGLPPNILEVTDISQLLGLIVAKEALQDAGYWQDREFNREMTGVILGAVSRQLITPLTTRLQYPVWEKILRSSGIPELQVQQIVEKIKSTYVDWDTNAFPGMLSNVITGRIANRLDLGGTNCTIDAACASSLAALKMAISELQEYRSDMMLAGGVDPDNSIFTYVCFSKTPALSQKQQSKPFDSDSDGILLGEGLGIVVLKRLEDAQRDGDKIYAVIKGIGTSSDGKYKSIYAPRAEGQIKALQRAYEDAGVAPAEVGLIEAHGTGTIAGDRTEFEALKDVFSENNPNNQYIALGSVKSQIGHTKTAAGVASLIKTALALQHQILPPTLNITRPNPKLNLENSPFYLNTKSRPWIVSDKTPRRAGISSFGFGGTNFHVVLEEAPEDHRPTVRLHRPSLPVILSADSSDRLLAKCQAILEQLSTDDGEKEFIRLTHASKTPDIPIRDHRVGFVANSLAEALEKLRTTIDLLRNRVDQSWEHPKGIYYRPSGMELQGKVVALFSGQGSQYLEMGREIALNFPEFRQACAHLDDLMCQDGLSPLSSVLFPPPLFESNLQETQDRELQRTEYTQPAIGLLSSTLYKLLQQAGFVANFAAGHSFGELTALWAAGVLNDSDYYSLIKDRGQAMAMSGNPDSESGAMLAVKGDANQIEAAIKFFPEVTIANHNSPRQVVLAGARSAIVKAQKVLSEQGFSPILLPLAAAFHTPLVAHAQKPFSQALQNISFHTPQIPVYTNVTGEPYPDDPQVIKKILREHLLNQVLFRKEIDNIYAAGGYCFVEFGPRNILTNLVKEILGDRPHIAIALNASRQKDSDLQLREAVVQLQVAGLPLQNFDPYAVAPDLFEAKARRGMSVCLEGVNYLSEKTKQKIAQAFQKPPQPQTASFVSSNYDPPEDRSNGHQESHNGHHEEPAVVSTYAAMSSVSTSSIPSHKGHHHGELAAVIAIAQSSVPALHVPSVSVHLQPTTPVLAMIPNYQRILESLEYNLSQLGQYQSDTLGVHRQYLSHQSEYARTFFQLMQQQVTIFANTQGTRQSDPSWRELVESSSLSLMRFHEQQAETLNVHEQYLNHQFDYVKNLLLLTQKSYSLLLASDVANDSRAISSEINPPNGSEGFISGSSLQPTSPLPTSVIDKPKQVITPNNTTGSQELSENRREFDFTPLIESEISFKPFSGSELTETSTSRAVQVSIENYHESIFTPSIEPESTSEVIASPETFEISPSPSVFSEELSQTLIDIVSEKTGYPVEMIDLEMDLEADLGIDSIKRVEILGALQDSYPDLPQPNLEELAEIELRTLNQIIGYLNKQTTEKKNLHHSLKAS